MLLALSRAQRTPAAPRRAHHDVNGDKGATVSHCSQAGGSARDAHGPLSGRRRKKSSTRGSNAPAAAAATAAGAGWVCRCSAWRTERTATGLPGQHGIAAQQQRREKSAYRRRPCMQQRHPSRARPEGAAGCLMRSSSINLKRRPACGFVPLLQSADCGRKLHLCVLLVSSGADGIVGAACVGARRATELVRAVATPLRAFGTTVFRGARLAHAGHLLRSGARVVRKFRWLSLLSPAWLQLAERSSCETLAHHTTQNS